MTMTLDHKINDSDMGHGDFFNLTGDMGNMTKACNIFFFFFFFFVFGFYPGVV